MKQEILGLYDSFLGRFKSFRAFIKILAHFLEKQDFLIQENAKNQEMISGLKIELDSLRQSQPPKDSSRNIVRHSHDIVDTQRQEYYAQ